MKNSAFKRMVRAKKNFQPLEKAQKISKKMYFNHFYQNWKWAEFIATCVTNNFCVT